MPNLIKEVFGQLQQAQIDELNPLLVEHFGVSNFNHADRNIDDGCLEESFQVQRFTKLAQIHQLTFAQYLSLLKFYSEKFIVGKAADAAQRPRSGAEKEKRARVLNILNSADQITYAIPCVALFDFEMEEYRGKAPIDKPVFFSNVQNLESDLAQGHLYISDIGGIYKTNQRHQIRGRESFPGNSETIDLNFLRENIQFFHKIHQDEDFRKEVCVGQDFGITGQTPPADVIAILREHLEDTPFPSALLDEINEHCRSMENLFEHYFRELDPEQKHTTFMELLPKVAKVAPQFNPLELVQPHINSAQQSLDILLNLIEPENVLQPAHMVTIRPIVMSTLGGLSPEKQLSYAERLLLVFRLNPNVELEKNVRNVFPFLNPEGVLCVVPNPKVQQDIIVQWINKGLFNIDSPIVKSFIQSLFTQKEFEWTRSPEVYLERINPDYLFQCYVGLIPTMSSPIIVTVVFCSMCCGR